MDTGIDAYLCNNVKAQIDSIERAIARMSAPRRRRTLGSASWELAEESRVRRGNVKTSILPFEDSAVSQASKEGAACEAGVRRAVG